MIVQSSTFDAIFGSDPLGRFTAAVVMAVPEFDQGDTPIGHALATEFFHRPEPAAVEPEAPEPPAALAPERVYEWPADEEPADRPSPRPRDVEAPAVSEIDEEEVEVTGMLLELPFAGSNVEWFGALTEPDEDLDEHRRAS